MFGLVKTFFTVQFVFLFWMAFTSLRHPIMDLHSFNFLSKELLFIHETKLTIDCHLMLFVCVGYWRIKGTRRVLREGNWWTLQHPWLGTQLQKKYVCPSTGGYRPYSQCAEHITRVSCPPFCVLKHAQKEWTPNKKAEMVDAHFFGGV